MENIVSSAKKGSYRKVKLFIDAGQDVNLFDLDGMAPIHYAAIKDDPFIAQLLIENQADINLETKTDGQTPLQLAAISNSTKVLELLIDCGADIDKKTTHSFPNPKDPEKLETIELSAIDYAAAKVKLDAALILFLNDAIINTQMLFQSLIMEAASSDHEEFIREVYNKRPELFEAFDIEGSNISGVMVVAIVNCSINSLNFLHSKYQNSLFEFELIHRRVGKSIIHTLAKSLPHTKIFELVKQVTMYNIMPSAPISDINQHLETLMEKMHDFYDKFNDYNAKNVSIKVDYEQKRFYIDRIQLDAGTTLKFDENGGFIDLPKTLHNIDLTLKFLIEHGSDINKEDFTKKTALFYMLDCPTPLIEQFIKNGAIVADYHVEESILKSSIATIECLITKATSLGRARELVMSTERDDIINKRFELLQLIDSNTPDDDSDDKPEEAPKHQELGKRKRHQLG